MELIFEPLRGRPFFIEVGYRDTVLEIKMTVEKYQGIPVSMQTLIFKGKTLSDDADIEKCELLNRSHIQLHIASDFFKNLPTEEFLPRPSNVKFLINVKTPSKTYLTLEMDANDIVENLKERLIQETEPIPINNDLVVHVAGVELHHRQMLLDHFCLVSEYTDIDISYRPSPPPPPPPPPVVAPTTSGNGGCGSSGGGSSSKKLKVMVLTKCGTRKIPVEVNGSDNVGLLRKELQKLQQRFQFHLPSDGYFFIYKQNVMDDDKSFRWHHVAQGDTIEIFNGSVTGGS